MARAYEHLLFFTNASAPRTHWRLSSIVCVNSRQRARVLHLGHLILFVDLPFHHLVYMGKSTRSAALWGWFCHRRCRLYLLLGFGGSNKACAARPSRPELLPQSKQSVLVETVAGL